jgi:hypothetical protein
MPGALDYLHGLLETRPPHGPSSGTIRDVLVHGAAILGGSSVSACEPIGLAAEAVDVIQKLLELKTTT